MTALTDRQREVLFLIYEMSVSPGYEVYRPPTLRELGKALGVRSSNGVREHLLALEKKGYVKRTSGARGIRVVKLP